MLLIDDAGWHGARLPELRGDIYENLKGFLGNVNPNGDSLIGQTMAISAESDLTIIEAIGWTFAGHFISMGEGIQLDGFGEEFNLPRFGLTLSSAYVLCLLEPGEDVTAGKTFLIEGIEGDWLIPAEVAATPPVMNGLILAINDDEIVSGNTYTMFIAGRPYATQYVDGDTSDSIIERLFTLISTQETSLTTFSTSHGLMLYVADGRSTTQFTYSDSVFTLVRTSMPAIAYYQSETVFPGVQFGYDTNDDSVLILANGVTGFVIETDEAYRLRLLARAASGRVIVSASRPGIANAIRAVAGVTFASVVVNRSMETDENGIPGKSIQCFVAGGDDVAVAQAIYDAAAAECGFYGDISATATDSDGITTETVYFSRQAFQLVYVSVSGDTWDAESTGQPDDYEPIALSTVVAYFAQLEPGNDVFATRIKAALITAFPTMTDVTVFVDTVSPPAGATVAINNGVVAVIDDDSVDIQDS